MMFFVFFLLSTFNPSILTQDFQVLQFGEYYTNWSTNGNLTPTLFRVVLNSSYPPPAIRVSVTSEKVTLKNPLTVNVIRGKTVHNIALPRIQSNQAKKYVYWFATDTLCDDDRSQEQLGQPIYISVASSLPSEFSLLAKSVPKFNYREPFTVQASPSEPRYFMYTFPDNVEKVDIRAYSDSGTCARLIVRRENCPLFDGSGMLELSGDYFYQTFTKFSGFSISKADIGPEFHIALTVMPDDSLCGSIQNLTDDSFEYLHRIKVANISVNPVAEQTFVSMIPLLVYAISIIVVLLLTYFKYRLVDCYENNEPSIFEGNDSEANVILDKVYLFDKPDLIVSHKEYQKQRLVKDSKYFNFLFFQIFGAILPALTTLFQSQQQSSSKQNLDTCHLNYLCSIKLLYFNSVNSILSVSSLGIVGILNLIIVFRKKIFCYQVPRIPTTHGIQQRDAPKVVCLLSLVAMSNLGIVANNCPNKTLLHFYIYTSLWIFFSALMWMYSKRHGVRKWQQFYIIAVSSVFGFLTFAENTFDSTPTSKIILKLIFLMISIFSTGYFCCQYYYERPSGLQQSQWITSPLCGHKKLLCEANGVYKPLESKVVYIVLAMSFSILIPLATILFPTWSITQSSFNWAKGHLGIYFFNYLVQKIRFEHSSFSRSFKVTGILLTATFLFFEAGAHAVWAYYLNTYSIMGTPAQSRELNKECVLPGIDWNDVRHYNCALNWFLFVVLMDFVDSNLKGVPKKRIFVF